MSYRARWRRRLFNRRRRRGDRGELCFVHSFPHETYKRSPAMMYIRAQETSNFERLSTLVQQHCVFKELGRRKPRRRRKKINMQVGRNFMKWEEIAEQLNFEDFVAYGSAETHLRDTKEPPNLAGYFRVGCNRCEGERKGLEVLVKGRGWESVRESCREHMWLKYNIRVIDTFIGFVYLKKGNWFKRGKCTALDVYFQRYWRNWH